MTREEFTGVTYNDLDPSGTRISKVIGVFHCQQLRNRDKYTAQRAYFMNQETTDKIIAYARNTESG